jgi:hypothetical protein
MHIVLSSAKKTEITGLGIRHAGSVAPSNPQTLALTSPTSGGRSIGIVHSRPQATEFVVCKLFCRSTFCKTRYMKSLKYQLYVHCTISTSVIKHSSLNITTKLSSVLCALKFIALITRTFGKYVTESVATVSVNLGAVVTNLTELSL